MLFRPIKGNCLFIHKREQSWEITTNLFIDEEKKNSNESNSEGSCNFRSEIAKHQDGLMNEMKDCRNVMDYSGNHHKAHQAN